MIGIRRLLGLEPELEPQARPSRDLGRLYRQGIVVNTLNPKTALFFLAFLPQFVDPDAGAAWAQILVLGLLFAMLGFLSDSMWALVSGTLGERLRLSPSFPRVQRYVSGSGVRRPRRGRRADGPGRALLASLRCRFRGAAERG